jgi:probable selenium-dependent hydroxylase accessory protein YqeC
MTNDFNKELSAHAPSLAAALGVRPGITAIIGSGGKTSLMRALSRQLSANGSRVLLTTTTHILPFKDLPCLRISMKEDASWVLDRLAEYNSHAWEICFGSGLLPGCGAGFVESFEESASFNPKLSEPGFPLYELLTGADYILAEADGARHHYMKAHAHYEPVIPERCGRTILVIGAQGFGMRVSEAVHRPEIFCRLTGAHPGDIVTPALYAGFLRRELEGGLAFDCILLNGVDCERRRDLSEEFAAAFAVCFGGPVVFADLPLA